MADLLFVLLLAGAAYVCADRITAQLVRATPRMLLDIPNARSSHARPTPRGGGLAILLVVLGGVLAHGLIRQQVPQLGPYFMGATLVAVISLADDLRSLPAALRLAVHVLAALLVVSAYTHGRGFPLAPLPHPVPAGLTVLWIVGLTNAYNFMDGIDGIAAVQAIVAGVAWLLLGSVLGLPLVALVGALAAAGAAGFLRHNRPPARIFMGDVGSAFLGYTFAVLPLMALGNARLGFAALLIVGCFVFDTTFTFLRRLLRGENVVQAHRSHLYQRLVIAGSRHASVSALYGGLGAACAAAGVAVALAPRYWLILAAVLTLGSWGGLWLFVRKQERTPARAAEPAS